MATKKVNTASEKLNVSLERRVELALHAGYEIESLADLLVGHVRELEACDSGKEEVAIYTFLDRLKVVGSVLVSVGLPSDDFAHDNGALSELMRIPYEKAAA